MHRYLQLGVLIVTLVAIVTQRNLFIASHASRFMLRDYGSSVYGPFNRTVCVTVLPETKYKVENLRTWYQEQN